MLRSVMLLEMSNRAQDEKPNRPLVKPYFDETGADLPSWDLLRSNDSSR